MDSVTVVLCNATIISNSEIHMNIVSTNITGYCNYNSYSAKTFKSYKYFLSTNNTIISLATVETPYHSYCYGYSIILCHH